MIDWCLMPTLAVFHSMWIHGTTNPWYHRNRLYPLYACGEALFYSVCWAW